MADTPSKDVQIKSIAEANSAQNSDIRLPISIAVITLNEEMNITRCLESVSGWVAEVVVIDSGSTDRTVEIARRYADKVEVLSDWPGFAAQKNRAIERCSQPWVFTLDGDECFSDELREAMIRLFAQGDPPATAYRVCRRTEYLGAWIWHAWYPEWRLRLFRRGKAQWEGLDPHETLEVDGTIAKLPGGDLLHYTYRDLDHHMTKTVHYARLGATKLAAKNTSFSGTRLIFSPLSRLLRILIIKQAWRDGWRGFIIAGSSAMSAFLKYAYLYELTRTRKNGRNKD